MLLVICLSSDSELVLYGTNVVNHILSLEFILALSELSLLHTVDPPTHTHTRSIFYIFLQSQVVYY